MPIYEYRCKDCGNVSEFQMKMSDPHPSTCPTCGHNTLSKIMSLPSFQLKGGGWYSDAYDGKSNKAASGPKAEGSDSSTSSAPAASSGGDSSSAPAASSPAAPASASASAPVSTSKSSKE
ncbi:MAG: zinc ribbon domain-containing protein [Proteobacteria bacterium]|nr:MAG: zinc ribbon domain-containing protein [Pseudomonadota bacterium]